MTIAELLEKMDAFTDEERKKYLGALLNMLTPVSNQTIVEFQQKWDGSKPFNEFIEAQNRELKTCVGLEMTELGTAVRQRFGLEPITRATVIPGT
jgi:hypothetical protein